MDEGPVAAWNDGEFLAPLAEPSAARARRLSKMLRHALVERGMNDRAAELAAETLLDALTDEDIS
jgi:hypothetical protein